MTVDTLVGKTIESFRIKKDAFYLYTTDGTEYKFYLACTMNIEETTPDEDDEEYLPFAE